MGSIRIFKKALVMGAAASGLMTSVVLAGCAGSSSLHLEPANENGLIRLTATNKATGTLSGESISIKDGECLVLSPVLEKGSVQVKLYEKEAGSASAASIPANSEGDITGEPVFDETVSGRIMSDYEVAPGEYTLMVTANEATGNVGIVPFSISDMNAQDAALEDALKEIGVEAP